MKVKAAAQQASEWITGRERELDRVKYYIHMTWPLQLTEVLRGVTVAVSQINEHFLQALQFRTSHRAAGNYNNFLTIF